MRAYDGGQEGTTDNPRYEIPDLWQADRDRVNAQSPVINHFTNHYLAYLKKLVRIPNLNPLKGPVIFDALHGPGGVLFERLFHGNKKIHFIRKDKDPLFGGVNPEPIEINLKLLQETVQQKKASIGIS